MTNILIAVAVLIIMGLVALKYQAKKQVLVPIKKNDSSPKKVVRKKATRKAK